MADHQDASANPSKPRLLSFAAKSTSNYAWTPEQAVSEFLEDIRAGKIKPTKMVITYFEEIEDGKTSFNSWRAMIGKDEEIALLEMLKAKAVENWRAS